MKKIIILNIAIVILLAMVACNRTETKKQFEVSGKITNSTAKKVYLEEVPPGSNQGVVVDSFSLTGEGTYKLKADAKEALIYNLRLDKSIYPVASVINDVPKMELDVTLKAGSNEFAEKYEIRGSAASQQMKDYMYSFNNYLQEIVPLALRGDSMRKQGVPDSAFEPIRQQWQAITAKIRDFTLSSLSKADNPALYIFELGYYQGSAQQRAFGIEPIEREGEIQLLNDGIRRFPNHQGLVAITKLKEAELARYNEMMRGKWVGKPAPNFTLPDPNGNQISLSSYKGKFVLVDFWASWCKPCRAENPTVVQAYNKFKDKNFDILGVSLDNPGEKNNWLEAIKKDGLTWTQVSDLKGWESIVVPMYDFGQMGIPYNILVDPEGVVIAERLRGPGLENKLAEVLK